MSFINGVDCDHYPGDTVMQQLRQHGQFRVTGLYLTHWPNSPDESWLEKRDSLAGLGWGFLPVYVGLQSPKSDADFSMGAAVSHATEAAELMDKAGFAASSIVYLDLEPGDTPSGAYASYVTSWILAVREKGYTAGIYCSHLVAPWALSQTPFVWSFHIPAGTDGSRYDPDNLPTGLIDPRCIATQYRQNIQLTGINIPASVDSGGLDLNLCTTPDPSNLANAKHVLGVS